jgi:2-keto-4-pentenoate hydratase/2-oxohepta-3-ene-1,7-dioic acid hydratase in catechol pathway
MTVPRQPTFFMKSPSSLVGPGDAIWSNPSEEPSVDAEVELAIVIGRSIGPRDVGKASSAILGYSIANDVSARSFQAQDGQWCRAKSIDTFCPLGPWIVSPAAVDPNARLRSTINGEALQDGSLRDMICSPAEAVAYLSRWITLRPGDVILTGTPSGVGFARRPPVLLRPGDDVRVSIDGIGHLQNVVEERSVGSDWIAGSK